MEAYLNTNYFSVEDIVELLGYGVMSDHNEEAIKRFGEVLWPCRDAWFEDLQNAKIWDEPDIEISAKALTMAVEHIAQKCYEEWGE